MPDPPERWIGRHVMNDDGRSISIDGEWRHEQEDKAESHGMPRHGLGPSA
jgi:hypothetical protein